MVLSCVLTIWPSSGSFDLVNMSFRFGHLRNLYLRLIRGLEFSNMKREFSIISFRLRCAELYVVIKGMVSTVGLVDGERSSVRSTAAAFLWAWMRSFIGYPLVIK